MERKRTKKTKEKALKMKGVHPEMAFRPILQAVGK